MDNYFEQSVTGRRGTRENILYAACWVTIVLTGAIALFSALNIIGFGEDKLRINWLSVMMTVAGVALALLLYRAKDSVYCEYDYILWNSELEVCAVYNRMRRKKLTTIQLDKVGAWGPVDPMARHMHGLKPARYFVRPEKAWCLVYTSESGKQAALLELSEEMCTQIRNVSSALRLCEVKA